MAEIVAAIGVVAYENPPLIAATLVSLRTCTNIPHEIWLLGDGADAETAAFLESQSGLHLSCTAEPRGMAACLNRLAAASKANVLVLLEQGSVVSSGWLERMLHALAGTNIGLAGPSTNWSWNEQRVFRGSGDVEARARVLDQRFGGAVRQLAPLYSLADFCYAVRREVIEAVGPADESYGLGPCWEMDYNIRAERHGWRGVWVCGAYVERMAISKRREHEEALRFEASRRRYQDKFCGLRLLGRKADYRSHCRGDACQNFAPAWLIAPQQFHAIQAADGDAPAVPTVNQPLVSCIMPTYNRREFIHRAIGCFQRQDYPNMELIIVDDGSDFVSDLVPNDARVRYFRLPQKLTIGAKRNYACERASGEIIVHWDDDDWYPADRVRRQVHVMMETSADLSGTSRLYYYEPEGAKAFLYRYEGGPRPWVAGNTLAYRRTFWQRHRFPDIQVAEDSRFIWSAPGAVIHDLKDPSLCVATIHAANASTKYTAGAYWTPFPIEQVLALLAEPASPLAKEAKFVSGRPGTQDVAADPARYPLISCVMPTFNRRSFIPLALQCFRTQTYPRKELVVIDDGTDAVADLLEGVEDVKYRRLARRLTIGAKRNLACREAQGEFIAHWDDDDWYAPSRLELQVAPLLAGTADLTGFTNRFVLEMPGGQFWSTADELHRRMFVGDVHGGTLLFRKSLLSENVRYPESNLAEDAVLIQQAMRRSKRLMRLENLGAFVYLRHGRNAWKFETGRFLDPAGWNPTTAPSGFSSQTLDLYRAAAESANLAM
ncbi:MAG TPA: glycosyltransferase [Candidatus Angelobacter sp.]